MDKIQKLIQLKELLDSGGISEQEYGRLKNELLSTDNDTKESHNNTIGVERTTNGSVTLSYPGVWLLFDAKIKIIINKELHSVQSAKKGFEVTIPLDSDSLDIELVFMGIKSTKIQVTQLDKRKNYTIELEYDSNWGKISNEINLIENA
ncbi:MAG: SHOCT domain-containing protein [Chitinophagaceae bacterium]|nr:SHOCT domain-containing protein [Chitinophagaceae bacterium]